LRSLAEPKTLVARVPKESIDLEPLMARAKLIGA
jgi:hypothetical protein